MVFVPNNQPPEVLKPGKQALYLPSAPIASEFSAVLGFRFFTTFTMWCNHFDTTFIKESIVKWIAVVRLITNQLIGGILSKAAVYRILDKLYLVGRSAFHVSGDRKTRSVCNCHDLGALAAFGLANLFTPFFAEANVPSAIDSSRSTRPCHADREPSHARAVSATGRRNDPGPASTACRPRRW